jgi:hypothetical protein
MFCAMLCARNASVQSKYTGWWVSECVTDSRQRVHQFESRQLLSYLVYSELLAWRMLAASNLCIVYFPEICDFVSTLSWCGYCDVM